MIHLLVELRVKVDLCQQTVPYVAGFPVISYIDALKCLSDIYQAVQENVMHVPLVLRGDVSLHFFFENFHHNLHCLSILRFQ